MVHARVFGLLLCLTAVCLISTVRGEDFSRGLGSEIAWKESISQGLEEARESNKMMMLVIHKPWCGACKSFKPKFAASNEIKELSKDFVMVNSEDDEKLSDAQYSPDGSYFPRILFLDPSGTVVTNIFNEGGNENYKFYYSDASGVINSMNRALEHGGEIGITRKEL